ncbi:MAG: sulfite exporter TauE/SafE family protein [Pseudomonadota bacterium]
METLFSSFGLYAFLLFLLLGGVVGIIAGLFGVGGGLIIVPALIWGLPIIGVNQSHSTHIAVGTSLATIVVTSIAAIRAHHKRAAVLWRRFGLLTPGILLGAWLGGLLAGTMEGGMLQRIFGVFAMLVGLHLYFRVLAKDSSFSPGSFITSLVGVVIGLISALVGIGGGSMTVPFLHFTGVEMRKAVATSSACGLPIALSGALSFIVVGWGLEGLPVGSSGYVYWPVALIIVMTSSLFAPLGAALAHRLPGEQLKRGFGVFLVLIGVSLLVS